MARREVKMYYDQALSFLGQGQVQKSLEFLERALEIDDKYFPAWALEEDHPLVKAGLETRRSMGMADSPAGKWNFSTNGVYWAGKANIPSIGFGPGDEETAHTVRDSVPVEDLVKATEFYAMLPAILKQYIA